MVSARVAALGLLASAGSAAAVSSCPLSIGISSTTDHIAHVTLENTGSDAVTVLKVNTILSEHPTRDLLVEDSEGKQLTFDGVYVNPKRTDIPVSAFQTLQPGETVTADVNAAKFYKLAGVKKAKVTAIQAFKYVLGESAPTAMAEMLSCNILTSEAKTMIPDQSKVASDHILHRRAEPRDIEKRDVTYSSCSTSQTTSLKATVSDAITLASNAKTAASSQANYWTTWFKSSSVQSKTVTIYRDVVNVRSTSPTVSCTDPYSYCSDGSALLYTIPSDDFIVPCPSNGYWGFDEYSADCAGSDYDRAGSILHEMTHLYGTDDYAYGRDDCLQLSASQAAANADTYELYSESVRLGGCKRKN